MKPRIKFSRNSKSFITKAFLSKEEGGTVAQTV